MKTLYVVEYNYGYGDRHMEVIVESREDFLQWLKEHNEERVSDGEIEEEEDEFNLIQINLYKSK
jgi:heme/copper-type cytochrome/quinol oxidase subunit 2